MNMNKVYEQVVEQVNQREVVQLSRFDPKTTKLCVIDMNNGFAKAGALYSNRVEDKIQKIAHLTEKALDLGFEVLAYTDHHPEDAKEFSAYPAHCVGDTIESDLIDELIALVPKGLKEIHKNSTNGVLAYNPAEAGDAQNYLVVGCVTDICVYQYAVTLRAYLNQHQLEGDVYVSQGHVQTFDIEGFHHGDLMHYVFLKSMMDNGVKVVEIEA